MMREDEPAAEGASVSYSPTISDPVFAKQRKQNKTEKSARLWMKENFVVNIDVGEAV